MPSVVWWRGCCTPLGRLPFALWSCAVRPWRKGKRLHSHTPTEESFGVGASDAFADGAQRRGRGHLGIHPRDVGDFGGADGGGGVATEHLMKGWVAVTMEWTAGHWC